MTTASSNLCGGEKPGNCHSNQTDWLWYSDVAPVSWWTQMHVRKGREELNFSKWTSYSVRQRRAKLLWRIEGTAGTRAIASPVCTVCTRTKGAVLAHLWIGPSFVSSHAGAGLPEANRNGRLPMVT
jgi:hypothetical protein